MDYALIGCGRVAVSHAMVVGNKGIEFVAMCDIADLRFDTMLDKAGCGSFPDAARYIDYKKMLIHHPETELLLSGFAITDMAREF